MTAKNLGFTCASLMNLPPPQWRNAANTAHRLGYETLWTAETVGPEAFGVLSGLAPTMPGAGLGTGVLALQLRTPMLAAMGAATLAAMHDTSFRLGVGVSSPVVVSRWHGQEYEKRPVSHVREYLTLLRECLSGEQVTFDGDYYNCHRFRLGIRLGPEKPKIVLGALNHKMLSVAGELADGVLLNYLPPHSVPECISQVRAGEAAAGREPGSCEILAYVHVGVTDHPDALVKAKRDLFSYIVVPAYARAFTRSGFGDSVDEVLAAHAEKRRDDAIAAVSDDMVDAINTIGDSARVAAAVASYVDAGVEHPVIMPMPWGTDRDKVVAETLTAARSAIR